ncbi:MAG: caspase domain-containing protein [Planctomycetota bacterium]
MNPTKPSYDKSHALVIGINQYSSASPLLYAVNDANAVADTLERNLGFESVIRLLDLDATRENIHREFLRFASDNTNIDDRLFIFFAGHGHTERTRRGDVGYLVPYDGIIDDLSSLLRWDTLTRDAELIAAKHILFIMDACYGGLAITRSLKSGASRFLKDMLQRHARQVLSAGKADELVSDSGGPRSGHSIFTGHFLDAITGAAAANGIITANGVMAYVYQHVGTDPDSTQTPHYGYLNGDGDFVFNPSVVADIDTSDAKDVDVLISIPGSEQVSQVTESSSIVEVAKSFLATPETRIKLHDLVAGLTRSVMAQTSSESFPVQGKWSESEFADRLDKYNKALDELRPVQMLLGFWGTNAHMEVIALPAKRLSERANLESGLRVWLGLRWYPVLMLLYSCGLGALASQKYANILALLHAKLPDPRQRQATTTVIQSVFGEITEIADAFKSLPGHERQYVPVSEYLFKHLQPTADDVLFVGGDYENLFDRLELLLSLECAFVEGGWGPIGRFGWKHSSRRISSSPLDAMIAEAESGGDRWPPIREGFFGGSIGNFQRTVAAYKPMIDKLSWW